MQFSSRRSKLYNAGDRIQNTLFFSNPEGHDVHCICRYGLDAPAGKVFTIPEMILLGSAVLHVQFVDDILRDYGARGVILIDANYEPPLKRDDETGEPLKPAQIDEVADADIPIACNEIEAQVKGKKRWAEYIDKAVRSYLDQCEQIRSAGGVPIAASGWMKRALQLAGIIDPAEAMMVESKKQTSLVEELQASLKQEREARDAQQKQIDELIRRMGPTAVAAIEREVEQTELAGTGKQKAR